MSTPTNDGGPAFPHTRIYCESPNDLMHQYVPMSGMSLRDWFAGQALSSLRVGDWTECKDGAQYCYDYADAMIAARTGTKPAN
jgi:hypothetical protein